MESRKGRDCFVVALLGVLAMTLGCDGGDDNTDCTGPYADPCACWGECGDADGDVRPDSDAPVQYGRLRVTSTPVEGAEVQINGAVDPRCATTPCELELEVGTHSLHLTFPGRLHLPDPVEASLPPEGTAVNIFLGYNLAGRWRRQDTGQIDEFEMTTWEPDAYCPDGGLQVWGVQPVGRLCLETDDTLSLCKTRAPECDGTHAEGQILENGRLVEFCAGSVDFLYDRTEHLCRVLSGPGAGTTVPPTIYRKLD